MAADEIFTRIRHLVVEVRKNYSHVHNYWTKDGEILTRMTSLQRLTILDLDALGDRWWFNWDTTMTKLYSRDDPAPFFTTILSPLSRWPICEINSETYFRFECQQRRNQIVEHPDWFEDDYIVSDDDDHVGAIHRYRTWGHIAGCDYPLWHPTW